MERGREGWNESGGREERGRGHRAYDNSRTQDNIRSKLTNVRLKSPVSSQMLMLKCPVVIISLGGRKEKEGKEGGREGREGWNEGGGREERGGAGRRKEIEGLTVN